MGCSLGDLFTWYSHSHVGYADQKVASFPTSPQDASKWIYQPWEVPASGIQTATRQEIAMPFQFFYAKWTPYLSGEAAYWGEDLNGDPLTRLTGQAGLRTSTPFWQVFPDVQSTLFNIN
ncbi:MAG: organic solvent tolerance protein OstA, partial [Pirellulaceae bacterium]